jgi:peptidoglycan/xylan/chitin deacetylase (PgdA/CDA1 family)
MAGMRRAAIKVALETLYFSGAHRLASQYLAGFGAILTFHRVRPATTDAFQPNRLLEITPEFLEEVIASVREAGIDVVSLDEAHRRLVTSDRSRRFVALTFDDGYRDNLEFAWPVLKRHEAPFTLFVASAFADGRGELWWAALEKAIARHPSIEVELDGVERVFDCATPRAKQQAFDAIYVHLRSCTTEDDLRRPVREIAFGYGVDMANQCGELCMGWDELAEMAADPLVTIGAHTVSHPILAKLPAEAVRAEMAGSVRRIEEKLGVRPAHFSYPVGGPDAAGPREFVIAGEVGFKTAVTTHPGVLFANHARHLHALPRISVNGEFQRRRYIDVLLSGAPTALMNGFRRVDAA